MVFLKEGKMTPPPPHIEAVINTRRRRPSMAKSPPLGPLDGPLDDPLDALLG